eukprot:scaffold7431_cov219-Ochromonas_danica.AAC.1
MEERSVEKMAEMMAGCSDNMWAQPWVVSLVGKMEERSVGKMVEMLVGMMVEMLVWNSVAL